MSFIILCLIWQPIHYASDAGKLEIVKILCAKKVNLNYIVSIFAIFYTSAIQNSKEFVTFQKKNFFHTTARYWASINHHRDVEKYLVSHGAYDSDKEFEMIMKKLDLNM